MSIDFHFNRNTVTILLQPLQQPLYYCLVDKSIIYGYQTMSIVSLDCFNK